MSSEARYGELIRITSFKCVAISCGTSSKLKVARVRPKRQMMKPMTAQHRKIFHCSVFLRLSCFLCSAAHSLHRRNESEEHGSCVTSDRIVCMKWITHECIDATRHDSVLSHAASKHRKKHIKKYSRLFEIFHR